ncbi:4'-phosphopantetheinyl transferase family protein [Burkholderia gladioli]|uniref:4'-phosphopantetheinyl transferase family protein n=1 Tax=Burkholderia gladioli TaxID=28095 RepID=UPI001640FCE4|nr:4'-phosphopantetheinyl transferase superfamily protein [Burkholderia gladioli]
MSGGARGFGLGREAAAGRRGGRSSSRRHLDRVDVPVEARSPTRRYAGGIERCSLAVDRSRPVPLPDNEAHIWIARAAGCDTPRRRARYLALLDAAEAERHARLATDALRFEYLLTRALCRSVLSAYQPDVAPAAWRFRAGEFGRPELAGTGEPPLRFNLSNAGGLVACVITRRVDAGIDIEDSHRRVDIDGVAAAFFTRDERRALRALPPPLRRERFFALWTLKEAYLKARGVGLSAPLDACSFSLPRHARGTSRPRFAAATGDTARDWQFERFALDSRYRLALGLRRGPAPPMRLRWRECVPEPGR